MPTYEYECHACGHEFEKFQSMTARPLRKCPVCGKKKVQRLIGAGAGIIFKGSGFYETDYKRDGSYKDSAKKEKDASSESASSGKKTEESKSKSDAKGSDAGSGKAESKSNSSASK